MLEILNQINTRQPKLTLEKEEVVTNTLGTIYKLPYRNITKIYSHKGRDYSDYLSRWFLFIYAEIDDTNATRYTLQKIPIKAGWDSVKFPIDLTFVKTIQAKNNAVQIEDKITDYLQSGDFSIFKSFDLEKDDELRARLANALKIGLIVGVCIGILVLFTRLF